MPLHPGAEKFYKEAGLNEAPLHPLSSSRSVLVAPAVSRGLLASQLAARSRM